MAVFFRCCKYVVSLLRHRSIWNFVMKNKEKNQAYEELVVPWTVYNYSDFAIYLI